jgi:hypothetical protein
MWRDAVTSKQASGDTIGCGLLNGNYAHYESLSKKNLRTVPAHSLFTGLYSFCLVLIDYSSQMFRNWKFVEQVFNNIYGR